MGRESKFMYLKKYFNKKNILSLLVIAIFIFTLGGYTKIRAEENIQNKVVIVPKINDGNPGIFNDSDGFWYPGRTLSKQFLIKNGNTEEIEFNKISVDIKSVNQYVLNKLINPDEDIYKDFLKNLKVQLKDGNKIIFDDTFENFSKNGVPLDSPIKIAAASEKELTLTLHFEEMAGNLLQDLKNLFNLNIQYILKDGRKVDVPVTTLPQTGGPYNLVTLLIVGLTVLGIGLIVLGRKEETSLKNGGTNNAK